MANKKPTTVKRTRKHVTHNQTHIMLKKGLFVYAALVFLFFILIALSAFTVIESKKILSNYEHRQEAMSIYSDLDLDKSYIEAGTSINTDHESYTINYGRNADRSDTFDDLAKQITAAGFTKVESPDNGDFARQDSYQNDDGQTIQVAIETAAWHNGMLYGSELPDTQSKQALEQGPVYVTIKLNLDDEK